MYAFLLLWRNPLVSCKQIPPWTECYSEINKTRLKPVTVAMEKEVITAVQNLANSVIANAASRTLTRSVMHSISKALLIPDKTQIAIGISACVHFPNCLFQGHAYNFHAAIQITCPPLHHRLVQHRNEFRAGFYIHGICTDTKSRSSSGRD